MFSLFSRKNVLGMIGVAALVTTLGIGSASHAANNATYYVSTTGNDTNDGSAQDDAHALRHFDRAMFKVGSFTGNKIIVMPGTYQEAIGVRLKNSLTIQAYSFLNGGGASIITANSASAQYGSYNYAMIAVQGSNNITIQGLVLDGGKGTGGAVLDAGDNCSGVAIAPYDDGAGTVTTSKYVYVAFNTIRNMGEGGVVSITRGKPNYDYGGDYITIKANDISGCLSQGQNNSSNISLLGCVNSNTSDTTVHNTIERNKIHDSYNNVTRVVKDKDGNVVNTHTDGNGIIIDTCPNGPPTLIQNNVVWNNSGRGIYVFNSDNVTILNNTCYQNCRDQVLAGNSAAANGHSVGEMVIYSYGLGTNPPNNSNIVVYNNETVTRGVVNGLTIANYVVLREGKTFPTSTTSLITEYAISSTVNLSSYNNWRNGINYLRMMPSTPTLLNLVPAYNNIAGGDFSQTTASQIINAGTNTKKAANDITGLHIRPYNGGTTDLGAYESQIR